MKKIKKRGAVYGVIALLLCVAVYLNWSYVGAPDELLVAEQTDPDSAETGADASGTAGSGEAARRFAVRFVRRVVREGSRLVPCAR